MFAVGDCVIFIPDGARGTVIAVNGSFCHIVWEDWFTSWEKSEELRKEKE
ncbi:hypothetical protein ACFCP7_26460 [Paenibacillus elgii]